MDVAESAPSGVANPAETFCQYLARQLVAVEGFTPGAPAELHEIAAQCDDVLSSSDGHSSVFVALIDREAHPDKAFTLAATHVREIAEAYRVAADRAGRPEKAVAIHLVEVGDATPDQAQRLGDITPRFLDNFVAAWAVDPRASTIWTTAGWGGRAMRSSIRRLLDNPREGRTLFPG
jgi:hypothetical protein